MVEILHAEMPPDLAADASLPGVRPLSDGAWLRVDDAYAAQMSYRRNLLNNKRQQVLFEAPQAQPVAQEVLRHAEPLLAGIGFGFTARHILCPDGSEIDREADSALAVLGQAVQEDICILTKQGDEHVLVAACLCFPASWTLSEKAGRPLRAIHGPVDEYDANIATRVQRLFDGVQVGRPLWRNNLLRYADPDLFQPRSESDPQRAEPSVTDARYMRAERQSILRLPESRAIVFSIHSYVTRVPQQG